MPDHTLNETLGGRGAGIEVNLSGRGEQLHRVCCVDELSIGQNGAESGAEWTLLEVALGAVQFVRPLCNLVVTLHARLLLISEVGQELESIFDAGLGLRQDTLSLFTLLLHTGVVGKHLTINKGCGVDGVEHVIR